MDFIAEMVLGYIDECLSRCLDKKMDYRIIRYRDDYRIFTNNKKEGNTTHLTLWSNSLNLDSYQPNF
jgi:hypothetical protein